MKRTITLCHHTIGYTDQMFNISVKYGLFYEMNETKEGNTMTFTIREEIEDARTLEYFQDVLCYLFDTEPANVIYPPSEEDVSLYSTLLAFVDAMRMDYAGLKVAVSGAMEVADARGLIPDPNADTESRTIVACMAIENVRTFGKIAKGEIGLSDGLKEITETSVSALATIVKTKVAVVGAKVGQKIGAAVGAVFGPVGTAVGHFVGGAVGKMAGTAVGEKIVETTKKVCTAAKTVVSKVVDTVRTVGNTIKNGLRKLFSW